MTEQQKPTAESLLFRGGPPGFKFSSPGVYIDGTLVDVDTQHATKFNPDPNAPKEYKHFSSGDPIYEIVLTLQTDLRDPSNPNDQGRRRVFVSSMDMQEKLGKALKDSGDQKLTAGARVRVAFLREEGSNRKKIYEVSYTRAADAILHKEVEAVAQPEPVAVTQTVADDPFAGMDPALKAALDSNPELRDAYLAKLGK